MDERAAVEAIFREEHGRLLASLVRRFRDLDLAEDAIRLARILRQPLPAERKVAGLLGLMLLVHARRGARTGPDGEPVLLDDQDRGRWDRTMIEEGQGLVVTGLTGGPPGPYGVQAAIAALHDEAEIAAAYREALDLVGTEPERAHLRQMLNEIES